jgi:hypothetical protein
VKRYFAVVIGRLDLSMIADEPFDDLRVLRRALVDGMVERCVSPPEGSEKLRSAPAFLKAFNRPNEPPRLHTSANAVVPHRGDTQFTSTSPFRQRLLDSSVVRSVV